MRIMMRRSGQIHERQAVEESLVGMAMTMTTARVKRIRMAVGKGAGKGSEQRIGRG